jgi:hypothetical protein
LNISQHIPLLAQGIFLVVKSLGWFNNLGSRSALHRGHGARMQHKHKYSFDFAMGTHCIAKNAHSNGHVYSWKYNAPMTIPKRYSWVPAAITRESGPNKAFLAMTGMIIPHACNGPSFTHGRKTIHFNFPVHARAESTESIKRSMSACIMIY